MSVIAISSRPLYTTADNNTGRGWLYLILWGGVSLGADGDVEAPVSYVVAAREIGVVVVALLGTLVLREPPSPSRLLAAVVIFPGLVVIAVSR